MSKVKPIEKKIPALFRRNSLDHMMFGFVHGVRNVLPSTSIKEAVSLFMSTQDLTEDDYPLTSAMTIFNRMNKEFINLN